MKVAAVVALIAGAIAFLVVVLGNNTAYYRTADEALEVEAGTRFRLEGIVVDGSVDEGDDEVDFVVESKCVQIDVHHSGNEPELFQEGIPVVLEGEWAQGKELYRSDRIVIRHTEEYSDEERQRAEADEACDERASR